MANQLEIPLVSSPQLKSTQAFFRRNKNVFILTKWICTIVMVVYQKKISTMLAIVSFRPYVWDKTLHLFFKFSMGSLNTTSPHKTVSIVDSILPLLASFYIFTFKPGLIHSLFKNELQHTKVVTQRCIVWKEYISTHPFPFHF